MIPEAKLNMLHELLRSSSREELIWIHGYLNGVVTVGTFDKPQLKKLAILYGTETGNSKKVALQLTGAAKKNNLPAKCTSVDQYDLSCLKNEDCLLIVISTQGEGEPPATAKKFYEELMLSKADLSSLRFGVLALGDSSYPLFCKTGIDIDEKLASLGAKRIVPVTTCDVDFEAPANEWINTILSTLQNEPKTAPVVVAPPKKHAKKTFEGVVRKNVNMNDRGSDRHTYHIEIETNEEMDYEPGDSIAIVPSNREEVVDRIIAVTGIDPSLRITTAKYEGTVRELLTEKLNICYLLTSSVKKYAQITAQDIPEMRLDLIDLLRIYPVKDATQFAAFIAKLNPIAPRLYSISSALSADPRQVHITVSRHRFLKEDEQQYGLCSSFLGDIPVGAGISFYIHRSRQFKLPEHNKDIIMVGQGTGIASFRAFLQERDNAAASGSNWLFFGEKDFTRDFLYQSELQQYVQTGVLGRINLAFQKEHTKIAFVEDDLEANGSDVFQWLDSGAHFYLSGIKEPLQDKVEAALLRIIALYGNTTEEGAKAYFENLKKEDRYHKDVY